MHCFEESRILPCPVRNMFDVVIDVEAYPDFLPWVDQARVLDRQGNEFSAELVADLAGMKHAFRTTDRYIPEKLIEIRLLDGPFKFLESLWTFEEVSEQSCRVHFSIEVEFKSMMLDLVASPIFSGACKSMVHSFEQRAIAASRS